MGGAYPAWIKPWGIEDWTDLFNVMGLSVGEWTVKRFLGCGVDSMRVVMDELDGV